MKKLATTFCGLAVALLPIAGFTQGGAWPSKPIKVVVPFAAGAATDTVARVVLEQVSKQLGQPMIVENRPGAGGTIGASAVAHAQPDGYTFMVHSNSHTVSPFTYKNLNYDPQKDLTGVIPLASVPMVMVTSPQTGVKTLREFVAKAKAEAGKINYASAGTGGATHLGAERLRIAAGFEAVHIPTKGSHEALTEVITSRVHFYFSPVGLALQHSKGGRLLPLAVSSSKRSSAMPEVPTSEEAGFPNSAYDVWIALFAPAKTPDAIVQRLNQEAAKALRTPEVRARFKTLVMDDMIMSVDAFNAFLAKEFQMNGELSKAAGIQPN